MFGIGTPEMILIGLVALLLFGNRVPDVMRTVGKGVSQFKRGFSDVQKEIGTMDDLTR